MVQGCMLVIKKKCGEENCNECQEERCHNPDIYCYIMNNTIGICKGHVDMLQEYLNEFIDLHLIWNNEHPISLEGVFGMASDQALKKYIDELYDDKEKKKLISILNIIDILRTQL